MEGRRVLRYADDREYKGDQGAQQTWVGKASGKMGDCKRGSRQ